jgi:hypothetical protein
LRPIKRGNEEEVMDQVADKVNRGSRTMSSYESAEKDDWRYSGERRLWGCLEVRIKYQCERWKEARVSVEERKGLEEQKRGRKKKKNAKRGKVM